MSITPAVAYKSLNDIAFPKANNLLLLIEQMKLSSILVETININLSFQMYFINVPREILVLLTMIFDIISRQN